jgi:multicopper oxidase
MVPDFPFSGDRSSQRESNRRDFLLQATLGAAGAACIPAISLLSGCARRAAQDDPLEEVVTDYELEIVRREAAPDGRSREVFCFNGQLPGPPIRALVGETLRVKVKNKLDVPSTVHWHGMHQTGTWQMDGVANVSAPPIPPGEEFVYQFKAAPAGTHWYHSHIGVQYGDGLFGPLIVDEEMSPFVYDREETLLINDWFLKSSEEILADLIKPPADDKKMPAEMPKSKMDKKGMAGMGDKPDVGDVPFESFLFNGLGRFEDSSDAPLASIDVQPGQSLRLRLINGSSTYAYRFQIDGHRLRVMASDGSPLVPIEVDNLVINIGERYDVLLTADQNSSVWIRAATLAGGEGRALLRYVDAPGDIPVTPVEWGKESLQAVALRSPEPITLADNPHEIHWKLGGTMMPYRWNINDQEYPQADPVVLGTGEEVRFIIENPTGMDHPFHLHGHYFYVLGAPDALNLTDPPRKDTVNIPAGQSLALQWQAINPGRWFFHCHIEWHAATGMARVVEIGQQASAKPGA